MRTIAVPSTALRPSRMIHRTWKATLAVAAFALVAGAGCAPDRDDSIVGPPNLAPSTCRPNLQQCPGYPPPTDPAPYAAGLYTNTYSMESCLRESPDNDLDGVWDYCETALAQMFAPLMISANDCNRDGAYNRVGGEYYFAVTRLRIYDEDRIRIAWLPAYYKDCGGPGDPHSGDAEFIIHEIGYAVASAHWLTNCAFLSSHCYAAVMEFESDPDCTWYGIGSFAWYENKARGAPIIWVAERKHAHYVSQEACNSGAYTLDTCAANNQQTRFPVSYTWQNIGSGAHPFTDAAKPRWPRAAWDTLLVDTSKTEHFWTRPMEMTAYGPRPKRFNGWQRTIYGDYVKPYPTVLSDFGFNTQPVVVAPSEVWIVGQQTIKQYGNCTYQARTNFGSPPYTYHWVQNGATIGQNDPWLVTDNDRDNFWVQVTVTDGNGVAKSSEMFAVTVDNTAPDCIQ